MCVLFLMFSLLCLSFSLLFTLYCSLSLTFSLSLSLSLSLSVYLVVCLSVCLSVSLSFSLSLCIYFSLFLSLFLSLFDTLSLLHSFLISLSLFSHILMDIHADVERGMAEEHLLQPDSNEVFSTNNYGVRYTIFAAVCNKFAHQTQILSSLFDLLKLNPMLATSMSSIPCA